MRSNSSISGDPCLGVLTVDQEILKEVRIFLIMLAEFKIPEGLFEITVVSTYSTIY